LMGEPDSEAADLNVDKGDDEVKVPAAAAAAAAEGDGDAVDCSGLVDEGIPPAGNTRFVYSRGEDDDATTEAAAADPTPSPAPKRKEA
jgi:hypothetical protein